jgi:hypothetical protein
MTMRPSTRPRIALRTSRVSATSLCEEETRTWKPDCRAEASIPRMTSEKYSPQMSGRTTPTVFVRFVMRLRAAAWGA